MYKHSHTANSRVSDLDTQRHVNNSVYGIWAQEAQYAVLQEKGLKPLTLLERDIHFTVTASSTHFHRQQEAFASLHIESEYIFDERGKGFWKHKIFEQKTLAATLVMNTLFLQDGVPVLPAELKAFVGAPDIIHEQTDELNMDEQFGGVPQNCKISRVRIPMRQADLDVFHRYPLTLYWRFFEEGRWHFLNGMGLTVEVLFGNDIMFFLLRNHYKYYERKNNGGVEVFTWFENLSRVRSYLRQKILDAKGNPIVETRGEFALVSLSRSKAVRIPPFIIEAGKEYVCPPATPPAN